MDRNVPVFWVLIYSSECLELGMGQLKSGHCLNLKIRTKIGWPVIIYDWGRVADLTRETIQKLMPPPKIYNQILVPPFSTGFWTPPKMSDQN